MLQAYVAASSPVVQESDTHSTRFNPTKLYIRLGKYCKGFLSYTEMRKMHYVQFFGFLREANVMLEEEKQAQSGNRVHDTTISNPELASMYLRRQFGEAKPYQGETIALQ